MSGQDEVGAFFWENRGRGNIYSLFYGVVFFFVDVANGSIYWEFCLYGTVVMRVFFTV